MDRRFASVMIAVAAGVLVFVAASGPAAAQKDLPLAAELLDRAAARVGDETAREGLAALRARGEVSLPGFSEGTFEEIHLGEQSRWIIEFEGMGSMSQGTDGLVSYTSDSVQGVMVLEGAEQAPVRRMLALGRQTPWRQLYERAETVRVLAGEGAPRYELRMHPSAGPPETWEIEDGRVVAVELPLPDFGGGTIPSRFEFSDWKTVAGLELPHRRVQSVGDYRIEYRYGEIEPGAELTAEDVAPPGEVAEAIADPEKRAPRPPEKSGECTLETREPRPAAAIRVATTRDEVGAQLAILLPEVHAHLAKAGAVPSGPPFARVLEQDGGKVELEAGMPTAEPIEGAGRVAPLTLPGGRAAVTWHLGPLEALPDTHAALAEWIESRDLEPRGAPWEVYWFDPGIEQDPARWRTEIVQPVR